MCTTQINLQFIPRAMAVTQHKKLTDKSVRAVRLEWFRKPSDKNEIMAARCSDAMLSHTEIEKYRMRPLLALCMHLCGCILWQHANNEFWMRAKYFFYSRTTFFCCLWIESFLCCNTWRWLWPLHDFSANHFFLLNERENGEASSCTVFCMRMKREYGKMFATFLCSSVQGKPAIQQQRYRDFSN